MTAFRSARGRSCARSPWEADAAKRDRSDPGRSLAAGTRLLRSWRGEVHEVQVEGSVYTYRGTACANFSSIACAITEPAGRVRSSSAPKRRRSHDRTFVAQPLRCAIYTRKPSEEGIEQLFNSLHAQRKACEAYVLSQRHEGWHVLPAA